MGARAKAEALGLDTYVSRIPCPFGHCAPRSVKTTNCLCAGCKRVRSERSSAIQKKDPAKKAEQVRKWQAANPEKVAAIRERCKEKHRAASKRWNERNKGLVLFRNAMRRKAVRQATPPWVDRNAIQEIYLRCAEMREAGHDVHVDHIMPLRGRILSGLHVPWNLRIIPAKQNLSKGNRVRFADERDQIADERNQCIASYNALRAAK